MKKSQNIAFADTEKIKVKRANFRSWKKGKKWLFASSLIVTVIGAGALDSGKTVKADEVTPETIKGKNVNGPDKNCTVLPNAY
ncbi:MAG: KxYKxGKxW signal peptide domain-containing protein, partial [Lacticaseibacillus paracasei]